MHEEYVFKSTLEAANAVSSILGAKIPMRHFDWFFHTVPKTPKHHNCFTLPGKKNDAFLTELEKLWGHMGWKSPKIVSFEFLSQN